MCIIFFEKNYKTDENINEKLNKQRDSLCSRIRRFDIVRMFVLPTYT